MRTATYRDSSYRTRADTGSRVASWLLALAIAAALLLALLRMGGVVRGDFGDHRPLNTFDVSSQGQRAETAATKRTERARQSGRQRTAPAARERPVERTAETPPPLAELKLPGVMILSRSDYAASDIGKIKGTAPAPDAGADGQQSASAGAGDDTPTVGAGPGGEPLYAAEWYREPTRAETSPFFPRGQAGWGIVACRTAPRYHVEDCRELGESPGSGIARGLRRAAWQFLVRPPRRGGQPLIGAWVRIRFDITVEPRPGEPPRDSPGGE
ncbi:hypothetical protein K7957_04635 [Sphingomonas yunnanensis]|uniref:hypothetical protein n=1 Tax=Sphingomonas yunnanensis TaxID=310400 RepID=UPI001CA7016D|nr:hypothetical protein [Sphingomonas yunnanensis]MBY9062214.1 hypothetical protein [Sphingomonas yunnanensis]